jgi:trehalose 6-phosphate synthase
MADLCAYDLVGLQTDNDVRYLVRYLTEEAGHRVNGDGLIVAGDRTLRIGAFPIGIDTEKFAKLAAKAEKKPEAQRLRESLGQRQLVVGVDRLDYSKGLTQRFQAFESLLERWPEDRGRVTFLQIAPISRGDVARYRTLRRELEGMAGRINGRYAEFDWTPVRYLNKPFPRQTLAGFYRTSRVGLVTPVRDGMNLVAKEWWRRRIHRIRACSCSRASPARRVS